MPEVLCQQYKPVNLFLNGQYYGVYFIRERADAAFAALEKNLQEEANHAEN